MSNSTTTIAPNPILSVSPDPTLPPLAQVEPSAIPDFPPLAKTERVLMIVNGPPSARTIYTPSGPESYPDPISARQHLQTAVTYRDAEVFYMTAGAICLSDRNPDGTFDIEPLLIAPIPVVLRVLNWRDEPANPHGVMIVGRVEGILNYNIQLSHSDLEQLTIQIDNTVQLSYHLEQCTGGIVRVNYNKPPKYHCPPLINSLSELQRRVAEPGTKYGAKHRGRSFYQVTSTEREAPVGFDLSLIS